MALRIVLAGGGSGGHLFPLTTVKEYIGKNYKGKAEFLFLGPRTDLEKKVMKKHGIPHKWVLCGKLHRYMTFRYILDIVRMPIGVLQALWHLLLYMPDAVFSKGGFASVPAVLAARFYRIPVLIHESDSIPGLANKFLGSISNKIALTFERARIYFPIHKTILTGVPVRGEVIGGDPQKARELLGIRKEVKPVIFIIGGSQGAKLINEKIMLNIVELLKHYQVIHQTGPSHFDPMKHEAEAQGFKIGHCDYYPIAFVGDEIKHIFALADVVISRAGATAISELAANNKASILVPITKSANHHQRINAFEVSKVGGAVVLEESNFRRTILFYNLKKIISDKDFNQKLSRNIGKFYQVDATEKIARELLKLAGK